MVLEKLTYSKGEKFAEIAAAVIAVSSVAGYIVLMTLEMISGEAVLMILATLILYGIFTLCSTMPQHANLFTHPEKYTEKQFRYARRGCIAAKIILIVLLFIITAFAAG